MMQCAFGCVSTICCAGCTTPSGPIGLTATLLPPYDAPNRNFPLRSVTTYVIESANGPEPTSVSLPVLASIAKVTAEYGSLRKPTKRRFLSGLTASGSEPPGLGGTGTGPVFAGGTTPPDLSSRRVT